MTLTIRTNNHRYPILNWGDLTQKEKNEFTYLKTDEERWSVSFARYLGNVYDLSEFMRIDKDSPFPNGWDGYHSDSFFSGILIKYTDEYESVIMGTYYG